jgi:hypothetical protein
MPNFKNQQFPWKPFIVVAGIALFASNPWRELAFYESIAAHEGFGTTNDSYIIGFAARLSATVLLLPVAICLIAFGIFPATRFRVLPRFDEWTWPWGLFSTILAIAMVLIEFDYIRYAFHFPHHWKTALISVVYIEFIYLWWLCSISHRSTRVSALAS